MRICECSAIMTGEHLGLVEGRWEEGWTAGCRCLESNCTSTPHPTLQLQPLSPSPTPTSSFTHPPVMTAHGHMNIICIQLQPLSPSPTPPTTLHPLLTCHDITMTCERRWHPAVTPLSLPHPTPTTSFTHSPVITAWVYVNVVCIQLWSLSPSPTPPPASHTHLS